MRFFRKNRKLVRNIIILSLPFIAYGLIKLTLWYSTKLSIENFSQQNAAFVKLNYKKISSNIQGSVSVHDVTLFIPLLKESIQIKKLKLSTDNVYTLLMLQSKFDNKDIPKSLKLSIQGVQVDLDSALLQTISTTATAKEQTLFEQLSTLACGDLERFDTTVLKEMGYTNFNTDFDIGYNYDPLSHNLDFYLYENIDEFFSYHLKLQVRNLRKLPNAASLIDQVQGGAESQSIPQMGKIELTLEDDTFIPRKVSFCAKKNKSNKADYTDKHVRLTHKFLQQLGIKLNKSLLEAYKHTLTHPGNIIISADFSNIDNYLNLSHVPNEVISQLDIQLFVNNKPISPINIDLDTRQFTKNTNKPTNQLEVHDPNVKPKHIKKYTSINVSHLKPYHKHKVIVETIQGKTYKGQLIINSLSKIEIVSRKHGGEISYFVAKNQVKTIKVYK